MLENKSGGCAVLDTDLFTNILGQLGQKKPQIAEEDIDEEGEASLSLDEVLEVYREGRQRIRWKSR